MARAPVMVIASCGVHNHVPPNTVAAFEAAIREGCDMIETDFRRCLDGVIVFHDEVAGGRLVAEMTRPEICSAVGILPPTLDDFVQCCRGRIGVDLELKEDGLEEEVLEALEPLEPYSGPHPLVITSFHPSILRRVGELAPDVPTGRLTIRGLSRYFEHHPEWADYRDPGTVLAEVRDVGADFLLPDYADHQLFRAAGEAGIETIAWGVDTETDMRALLPMAGLRGMITSHPSRLRDVLAEPRTF